MSDKERKSTMESAVPQAGENLSEKQRQQMEKKGEAEHEDGERKESLIEEAEDQENA